eukprot:14330529-Alexandrium_andersonii.AAC.1
MADWLRNYDSDGICYPDGRAVAKRDAVTRQYNTWTRRYHYDPQSQLDDADLSPRARRTLTQLGDSTTRTHAQTASELGTVPGIELIN